MQRTLQGIARRAATAILTVLIGAFLSTLLIRAAPGYGSDEREMDPRLRAASIRAIRAERADRGVVAFYLGYLRDLSRGDLGVSRSLNRPIAELFQERLPVTARSMGVGLALGWCAALALVMGVVYPQDGARSGAPARPGRLFSRAAMDLFATALSGSALALPAAVIALLFLLAGWPPGIAVAVVIFPHIFRYLRALALRILDQPHVLFASAKGLSRARILAWHVLPVAVPQMAALAGVSVTLAFGALIPIEVVCDSPGFGHLAWQAAQGRDLPLLVNITVLITMVTIAVNAFGDAASGEASA